MADRPTDGDVQGPTSSSVDDLVDVERVDDDVGMLTLPVEGPGSQMIDLDPNWILQTDSTWLLNSDMDEESKAVIEGMLKDEEYYLQDSVIKETKSQSPSNKRRSSHHSHKKPWTEEEKTLFERGLEIYGKSWVKISQLIQTKSSLQVKNYASNYFKLKARQQNEGERGSGSSSEAPTPLSKEEALARLSTGVPTISAVNYANRTTKSPRKRAEKGATAPVKAKKPSPVKNQKRVVAVIALDKPKSVGGEGSRLKNSEVEEEGSGSRSEGLETAKLSVSEESSDEDVDVDIEDLGEDSQPELLKGRIVSPESIYSSLLKSANEQPGFEQDTELRTKEGEDSEVENEAGGKGQVAAGQPLEEPAEVKRSPVVDDGSEEKESDAGSDAVETMPVGDDGKVKEEIHEVGGGLEDVQQQQQQQHDPSSLPAATWADVQLTESLPPIPPCTDTGSSDTNSSADSSTDESEVEEEEEVDNVVKPEKEVFLDRGVVTQGEKLVHSDFFEEGQSQSKTPQRYMKIRNYILDSWRRIQPNYLTKTSVRPGLQHCGDVNIIGKIHRHLEQIGAINFGVDNPYKSCRIHRKREKKRKRQLQDSELHVEQSVRLESMRPRKRRVKDAYGQWIDMSELEGKTIDHSQKSDENSQKHKRNKTRQQKIGGSPGTVLTNDLFKLIPCFSFDSNTQAPFEVLINCSVLLVMDLHAHLSKTEVIGLLGGRYRQDSRSLEVIVAEPCDSLSTGMQCEMDPVSQTQACDAISYKGYGVVGWYHSHPTFAPNPSIQDIETQTKYQEWFAQGNAPFIGMIVSPYDRLNRGAESQIKCLTVSEKLHTTEGHRIPYHFNYTLKSIEPMGLSHDFLQTAAELVKKFNGYPQRVEMLSTYRPDLLNVTYLEKLCHSLKRNMVSSSEELVDTVLKDLSAMIRELYQT